MSKKKRASASRGRITLSLPSITCAGSLETILLTVINFGISSPDFRSDEKLFQLAYQFIGRAGRHSNSSKAFIQTFNIDNVYINHEEKTIYLNKIFKWFKKDFKNVIQFITKFLIEDIDYDRIKNYKIKYYKYDWSSNQSSN